jgi:hypothetical protein
LGAGGGGDYIEYIALCNYDLVPPDTDYDIFGWPVVLSQRMCLGANALRLNTDIDPSMYQARIVGATDGVNPEGWFNLTNATRSIGWHHARVVVGAPNGVETPVSFFIDNMVSPVLTHACVNSDGFNLLEVDADFGNTSGYFDDLILQDNTAAPTIATGPTNLTVAAGAAASFSVSGVSLGAPAGGLYWQKDGATLSNGGRISGANSATLTISGTVAADAGVYSCVASNIAGAAVRSAALTVLVPPTIDSQNPAGGSYSVSSGGSVTLFVTAHASNPINYQWGKNGTALANGGHVSGATTATLTITGFDATDIGSYACHLSNAQGATDSSAVTLSLAIGAPVINLQPTNQTLPAGATAMFIVGAAGQNLSYQWSKGATPVSNGGRIAGAASSALSISSILSLDTGSYSCRVSNASGSTNSDAAVLTVINPPVITAEPVGQVATNGSTVVFHLGASGTSLSYQWKKNGAVLSNGGDFSGVTTPDLTIHVTTTADAGIYTCTVSNIAGNRTSAGAALTLNQPDLSFFDNFETYSTGNPINYGRIAGTALDYNYGNNLSNSCPWWGASPPNICTYVSGQEGVEAYSGNNMVGGAYASVSGSDNDESFVNLSYRYNNGQLYYGNIILDWQFYDNGLPDYSDQFTLANFASRLPTTSDSSGYLIPRTPVQNLFIGAWPNLDTTKYQVAMMGLSDGTPGIISRNIAGTTKYFDTAAPRSTGWHHGRIVIGATDPATHSANAMFFVDDMLNAAFSRNLPGTNVGFNALHFVSCSIWSPQTTASAGFWDDVGFRAVNDPFIIEQPVSLTVDYKTTAKFTIVALGTGYQWRQNGANIPGATNATLTLLAVDSSVAGTYTCVVTGANGSIVSSPATLTVVGSPPFLAATLVGQKVVITWDGAEYTLQSKANLTDAWQDITGAASPYTNSPPLDARRFFQVRKPVSDVAPQ